MKSFISILCICLLQCWITPLKGQFVLPKVVPVSPTAASLAKYGEMPVATYTGVPNISLPIYEVSGKGLSIPISLSYHAGGIKVEELASWVGLGWSLNAGGVITKTVRGLDDMVSVPYYTNVTAFRNAPDSARRYQLLELIKDGRIDTEADIYYYNFGMFSGKFALFPDGNFHTIPASGLQISLTKNGNADCWIITTPNGVKYVFGATQSGDRVAIDITSSSFYNSQSQSENISKSAWYLMEAISPEGDKASFEYKKSRYDFQGAFSQEEKISMVHTSCRQCGENAGITTTTVSNIIDGNRLTKISFKGGQIEFVPETTPRNDLHNDFALQEIRILNQGQIKIFKLHYTYFNEQSTTFSAKRLRLDSLIEKSPQGHVISPYKFIYNNDTNLPDRLSLSKDHWGYYNGQQNTYLIPSYSYAIDGRVVKMQRANRNSSSYDMQANILKRIVYPTGGTTSFFYEANQIVSKEIDDSDTYVSKSESAEMADTEFYDRDVEVNGFVYNSVAGTSYQGANVKFEIGGDTYNYYDGRCLRVKLEGIDNRRLYMFEAPSHKFPIEGFIINGKYKFRLEWTYQCQMHPDPQMWMGVTMSWKELNNNQPSAFYNKQVGGLRIMRIVTDGGLGRSQLVTTYNYNQKDGLHLSSGSITDIPAYQTEFMQAVEDMPGGEASMLCLCRYNTIRSESNYPLLTTSGSYVGYAHVQVKYGEDGENGKTEYDYIDLNEEPDIIDRNFPYPPNSSFDFRRGLQKQQSEYVYVSKDSFRLVRSLTNEYEFQTQLNFNTNAEGLKIGVRATDLSGRNSFAFTNYDTNTEFPYLKESLTKIYDAATSLVKETEYTYNFRHFNVFQKKEKVNRRTIVKISLYAPDYASGTDFIDKMKERNIISYPIEEVEYQEMPNGEKKILNGEIRKYNINTPSLIKEVWEVESPNAISLNQFKFSNKSSTGILPDTSSNSQGLFKTDNSYKERYTVNKYDTSGNILEQQKNNDILETYLWGYNGKYPVARILGIDYNTAIGLVNPVILNNPPNEDALRNELLKLRSAPQMKNSFVFTYTYLPLIGITSETGPEGITKYYEYDSLGRLKLIRDHNKKILKQIDYQYQAPVQQ